MTRDKTRHQMSDVFAQTTVTLSSSRESFDIGWGNMIALPAGAKMSVPSECEVSVSLPILIDI